MRTVYFEEAEKKYNARELMVFEVAIVSCDDTDHVIETIEMVKSNCCRDLFIAMEKDSKVKKALKKHPFGVLSVINKTC